jgi:hypothetical protein
MEDEDIKNCIRVLQANIRYIDNHIIDYSEDDDLYINMFNQRKEDTDEVNNYMESNPEFFI